MNSSLQRTEGGREGGGREGDVEQEETEGGR